MPHISLPEKGSSNKTILSELQSMKTNDVDWHSGQLFGLIYEAGEEVEALAREAAWPWLSETRPISGLSAGCRLCGVAGSIQRDIAHPVSRDNLNI